MGCSNDLNNDSTVSELIDEDKKAKKKNDVVKQERGFAVEAVKDATTT